MDKMEKVIISFKPTLTIDIFGEYFLQGDEAHEFYDDFESWQDRQPDGEDYSAEHYARIVGY